VLPNEPFRRSLARVVRRSEADKPQPDRHDLRAAWVLLLSGKAVRTGDRRGRFHTSAAS
jgi:hypothetical protein